MPNKQRHSDQGFIGHDAVNAVWQAEQQRFIEIAADYSDASEYQRGTAKRKCNRETCQQYKNDRKE
jgi:hypothetical protein